ncbi:putative plastocyanin [Sesbania bispinosa]|nr:putative plastocyanin [Sesbania bispinosa]
MATVTSTAVAIPSFTGLKVSGTKQAKLVPQLRFQQLPNCQGWGIKASLKMLELLLLLLSASAVLASNAMAIECCLVVMMGLVALFPTISQWPLGKRLCSRTMLVSHTTLCSMRTRFLAVLMRRKSPCLKQIFSMDLVRLTLLPLMPREPYSFYCAPHQGAWYGWKSHC